MTDQRLRGKTALVTGATAGIGKETALGLARAGARVVLVGRNREKCDAVAREIATVTGNRRIEALVADLSLLADLRRLAARIVRMGDGIDVLVNNAGAIFNQRETTAEGLEKTFALNHLSYFLLTNLLRDKLSSQARIINVSSMVHQSARIDFDNLQCERTFSRFGSYAQSKLMNVLFTYELARRLDGSGVTVNCLHPGAVASDLGNDLTGFIGLIGGVFKRTLAITPAKGAETSLFLALAPEVAGVTGKYFVSKRSVRSNPVSYDRDIAARLWTVSENLVSQTF